MPSKIIANRPIANINGSTNFNHLSNVTWTIANDAKTKPVGVINDMIPCPQL